MQPAIMFSTCLSIPGNQSFSLISLFVLTRPWWPSCASNIALTCKEEGITILVPRNTSLVAVTVSSSLILLNALSAATSTPPAKSCLSESDRHESFLMRWMTSQRVGSFLVASWISVRVIALGTAFTVTKFTYSPASCSVCETPWDTCDTCAGFL